MKLLRFAMFLFFPFALSAQTIPAGTILPVRLETTLNLRHLHPNQRVRARVMQNIPGTRIRRGAQVVGRVIGATPNSVVLRFTAVIEHGRRIPVSTNLRAVASMLEVEDAQQPVAPPARGDPPETWETQQIGGDMVYRGGGHVMGAAGFVGDPTAYGVRDRLTANPPCRAAVAGNNEPQAIWLFASNACGVYGIEGLTIIDAGRSSGSIHLASPSRPLIIRSGSGWLLRIQG